MVKQISLMPPSSVSFTESTSTFQRRASAYMEYMRNREWANRAASSPPTPARISTITFLSPGLVKLLLGQLLHVRVAHQRLGVRQILPAALPGPVGGHHRLQLPLLLVELCHQGGVVIGLRRAQPGLHIRVVEIQRA